MGKGAAHLVADAAVGPDGAVYRRGRRRIALPTLVETATTVSFRVARLSKETGTRRLRQLETFAQTIWIVEKAPADRPYLSQPWLLRNPYGELAGYFPTAEAAVECGLHHMKELTSYGGRVLVRAEDGSHRYADTSGMQTQSYDPLYRYELELQNFDKYKLRNGVKERKTGFKIAVCTVGMTVGWVPEESEDLLERLLEPGFEEHRPGYAYAIPPEDPAYGTPLNQQVRWGELWLRLAWPQDEPRIAKAS